jgi:hypothetical protein
MNLPVYLHRVAIKDYKSIATCDVQLQPLTFLIGPNGGGKSNFLDALRFCADALRHSLEQAVRDRGGINEVRRRSSGRPNHFGIRLRLEVGPSHIYDYHFEIGARAAGGYAVQREECQWQDLGNPNNFGSFAVRNGQVVSSTIPSPPPASAERLYLVNMAGFPVLRKLYSALASMGFYSLNPERIRDLQTPDPATCFHATEAISPLSSMRLPGISLRELSGSWNFCAL